MENLKYIFLRINDIWTYKKQRLNCKILILDDFNNRIFTLDKTLKINLKNVFIYQIGRRRRWRGGRGDNEKKNEKISTTRPSSMVAGNDYSICVSKI